MVRRRKKNTQFVDVKAKPADAERLGKIYLFRERMGLMIFFAGITIAFVPAMLRQLGGLAAVGAMLGMPITVLGIVVFSMYRIMLKQLKPSP